jgi:asparagine synthase (glutamine-hydrolysing)
MCGLAGFVGKVNLSETTIGNCEKCLIRRGPDQQVSRNIELKSGSIVNLVFSRLAIIDLAERAMQPIQYNNLVVLLNGEIYNFRILKNKLEDEFGPQEWRTSGDVEVALRYIALKGIDAITDFDGMFAMALLDISDEKLYLARDFFGEKPLYFHQSSEGLFFGSEPKSIWSLSRAKPLINTQKVLNFLTFGYRSIFKNRDDFFLNLTRVDSGMIYEFSTSSLDLVETRKFKHLQNSRKTSKTRAQIVKDLRKLVSECVGRRLESDVPIAICLSGGIDSSIIAAIAKRDFGIALEAYTLDSTDARYSESRSAEEVARHLKIPHHIVRIEKIGFLERMERLTEYHEAPISTISYYIQSFLMDQIHRDGFKVSLMGSGADELFTGYYDHHLAYLAGLKNEDSETYKNAVKNWREKILPLIRNPLFRDIDYYVGNTKRNEHLFEGSEELLAACFQRPTFQSQEEDFGLSPLRNRMMNELFYEVVPVILHEDDRNSMMNSIENRSPFLSYEILEFMSSIPDIHLINRGLAKSLLREAFIDYLPDKTLFAPRKVGFNAGFSELCDVKSDEFRKFIFGQSTFWQIVNRDSANDMFGKLNKEDKYNKIGFSIVASKMFFDVFNQ